MGIVIFQGIPPLYSILMFYAAVVKYCGSVYWGRHHQRAPGCPPNATLLQAAGVYSWEIA